MLPKFIGIICLSLAAFNAEANALDQKGDEPKQSPQMQGDLRQIPVSSQEFQLAVFAGLSVVFVVMVAMLFRKYKGKRNSRREILNDGFYAAGNSTFTPTFFSSESSPAILVAQHDNDLRLFITNTLRLNYRVISTPDGGEALEKAIEVVPDLIITDRFMPGIDGPMLCRKLKSTEATSHVPVIIITPEEKDLLTNDWHQYADDHLFATFDARELLMRVNTLISQRKKYQEEYRKQIRNYPKADRVSLPESPFLAKVINVLETKYSDPMFGVDQLTDKISMSRLQLYRKLKALIMPPATSFVNTAWSAQSKCF
jgi:CheY-like chemotaxis protein